MLGFLLATACSEQGPPPAPPPPEVKVTEVAVRDVGLTREWVAELRGQSDIEIRARVQGFLEGIHFDEGRRVEEGQLLYTIDPSELLQKVTAAEADRAAALTLRANAEADVKRYRPLAAMKAVSERDLDNAEAKFEASQAQVEAAEARLALARIDLSYSEVRSPMDGLIGLTQAKVGDFVGGMGSATALNTVSRMDPIHARVSISEKDYLRIVRQLSPEQRAGEPDPDREAKLELILADGSLHPHKGRAETLDREVNADTGTLTLEVAFPNPERILRPGQYAKVRAVIRTIEGALLVPQRAVQELQGSFFLWVIEDDDTARNVPVTPGSRFEDQWIITEGVEAGQRIVVEGVQRLRPGTKVSASPYEPSAGAAD
jgi:membrane fusion protein (multidrug efflux system)